MQEINYYFDETNEIHPFTFKLEMNPNSIAPSNALRIEPTFKDGYYPCEKNGKWINVKDYRGKIVFSTEDKSSFEIKEIGAIPKGYTLLKPTEFEEWNGSKWILDEDAYKKSLVPTEITKRQLMLQLNKLGLYQKVMDLINQPEYLDLKIEYDCSTEFGGKDNLIITIAKQFDLSNDDIDNLFIEAIKL